MILLLLCSTSFLGCGPVSHIIHEGDNRLNYKSIFHENVPPDVEIANSLYVTYHPSFRPMVITTPDYEMELIVTKQWIKKSAKKLGLRKTETNWEKQAQSFIEKRVKERGREWYVPKDISEYESYMSPTSIPYVHMLVDKTPVENNRYRVFLSKH